MRRRDFLRAIGAVSVAPALAHATLQIPNTPAPVPVGTVPLARHRETWRKRWERKFWEFFQQLRCQNPQPCWDVPQHRDLEAQLDAALQEYLPIAWRIGRDGIPQGAQVLTSCTFEQDVDDWTMLARNLVRAINDVGHAKANLNPGRQTGDMRIYLRREAYLLRFYLWLQVT